MQLHHIVSHLKQVNLAQFAERHGLPLRTLVRIRNESNKVAPTIGTIQLVSMAIETDQRKEKN